MELLNNLALGFSVALHWNNVLYCLVGCLLGTLIGVLPGIGPIATIAMLLPATFVLPPVSALIMLAGIYYGAQYGGSTTAILVTMDESGGYYFPPLPEGKYSVWAQAITYQTAKGNVDLTKTTDQDFKLQPMTNQEDWIRQLLGDEFLAALPGDTPEDFRMKTQVRKNCTGCHSASYPLQHRFDADGWSKVLTFFGKHLAR